ACPRANSPIPPARTRDTVRRRVRYVAPCGLPLAAFPRGLLVEARLAGAVPKRRLDFGKRDAPRMEHDEEMVEEIGRFLDHAAAVLGDGGDSDFDRLLAEFFRAVGHALVDQFAGVGDAGIGLRTRLDALFEVLEGVRGHGAPP